MSDTFWNASILLVVSTLAIAHVSAWLARLWVRFVRECRVKNLDVLPAARERMIARMLKLADTIEEYSDAASEVWWKSIKILGLVARHAPWLILLLITLKWSVFMEGAWWAEVHISGFQGAPEHSAILPEPEPEPSKIYRTPLIDAFGNVVERPEEPRGAWEFPEETVKFQKEQAAKKEAERLEWLGEKPTVVEVVFQTTIFVIVILVLFA